MEKINFPQVISQSDFIDPLNPGRYQVDYFKLLESLEKEYDQRF